MTALKRRRKRWPIFSSKTLRTTAASFVRKYPALLKELVDKGKLMLVENEYLLQTKEGANWNQDFNRRRGQILNDDHSA